MNAPALNISQAEFADLVSQALHRAYGQDRYAVKRIAAAANTNVRAAKNWWEGRNAPDALHLLRLTAVVPELQAEVRRLANIQSALDPELDRAIADTVALYMRVKNRELSVTMSDWGRDRNHAEGTLEFPLTTESRTDLHDQL